MLEWEAAQERLHADLAVGRHMAQLAEAASEAARAKERAAAAERAQQAEAARAAETAAKKGLVANFRSVFGYETLLCIRKSCSLVVLLSACPFDVSLQYSFNFETGFLL